VDSGEDQGQDGAQDIDGEQGQEGSYQVPVQHARHNQQLEEGAYRSSQSRRTDFRTIHGRSHTKGSSTHAQDESAEVQHGHSSRSPAVIYLSTISLVAYFWVKDTNYHNDMYL